jgi:cobalt-zinc-cadmium efflux system membrane fusion protein
MIAGCSSSPEGDKTETISNTHEEIVLTSQQVANAGISFGIIEKHQLSMDVHAKGKLILPPQSQGHTTSPMGGTIDKILVPEGTLVKEGTPLVRLVSPELIRLQQEYLAARSNFLVAEKDYERQSSLAKENITPGKTLEEVTARYRELHSRVSSLRMELELMNLNMDELEKGSIQKSTVLVAPVAGYVDNWKVNPGEYVEPNTLLVLVLNKERLFIELMVFEKDIRYIALGQRVTFTLANLGGEEYEAKVLTIGKIVEENARTVKVLAEFFNHSPVVLPGMFVAAEIHTDEQLLDALPEEAVITENDQAYCFFTLSPDNSKELKFRKLNVKAGFREDGFVQVEPLQEIPAGARIVTKGTYFIKAEGLKQAGEGE